MKAEQFLSIIIAGALTIALIMAAGLYYRSDWAVKLALLSGVCMYLTQLADGLYAKYEPFGAPIVKIASLVAFVAWPASAFFAVLAILILIFA